MCWNPWFLSTASWPITTTHQSMNSISSAQTGSWKSSSSRSHPKTNSLSSGTVVLNSQGRIFISLWSPTSNPSLSSRISTESTRSLWFLQDALRLSPRRTTSTGLRSEWSCMNNNLVGNSLASTKRKQNLKCMNSISYSIAIFGMCTNISSMVISSSRLFVLLL